MEVSLEHILVESSPSLHQDDDIPSSTEKLDDEVDGNPSCNGNVDEVDAYCSGEGVVDNSVQVPAIGMTFRSWEEVETMFKVYGKAHGFGVARTQAACNVNKERRAMTWRCECWGKPNLKQLRKKKKMEEEMRNGGSLVFEAPKVRRRKSKKCECRVMVYASVNKDEWWEVRHVVLEHTGHDPKPEDARQVKEYRMQSFTSNMRKRVLNDVEVGVPIEQIHGSFARERDGVANMPITPKDMRHVADEARRLKMEGGDAVALMMYLDRMRRDNNEFFYSIRCDVTGGLQDVFWVDARSKAAYEEFGDVVCFDTTYMTNGYELPFANFVGVNHHGQTTLFGCALISHEDVETFTWVFQQWLLCMGGKAPNSILTDQAAAMRRPIQEVLPDTTHRWCLWHIMQKIPNKLGGYSKYKKIKRALKDVIYNSYAPEEFEKRWPKIIKKYKLQANDWLCHLWVERSMWVPAFLRDHFWAGMRTTQRVESIHSFFDKFVKTHTTLIEFGEKYIAAVEKRMCQERDADDRDRKWHRPLATRHAIERFFADIYTDEKFLEVSKQCERVADGYVSDQVNVDENNVEYVINDSVWVFKEGCRVDVWTSMRRLYRLVYNVESSEARCECRMFETHGIMCRHIIRVLFQNNVMVPPEMYVLDRWKKNLDRRHTRIKVAYHDPRRTEEVKRLDRMQLVFDVVADKACWNEEQTTKVIDCLAKVLEELRVLNGDVVHDTPQTKSRGERRPNSQRTSQAATPDTHGSAEIPTCTPFPNNEFVSQTLRDPPKRKKRGRPKGSRTKSVAEIAISKSKRKKSNRKAGSSASESGVESDSEELITQSPPVAHEKNVRNGSFTRQTEGETQLSSSNEGCENGVEMEDTQVTMETRSMKDNVRRRRPKKRLDYDFLSSSEDQSLSF